MTGINGADAPVDGRAYGEVSAGKSSFVIIGDARTGTTMLRHMLNQHRAIECAGELISNDPETIFRRHWVRSVLPFNDRLIASATFKKLRMRRFLNRRRSESVFGFKALYEQIPSSLESMLLREIRRFILIIRRDRVRRVLSLIKARQGGSWNLVRGREHSRPKNQPITIELDELRIEVERSEQRDKYWTEWVRGQGSKGVVVAYEDLVHDQISVLGTILEALGLERDDAKSLEPETVRMSDPASLGDLIANYDELIAAAAGSPMASILKEAEQPLT